MGGRRFIERSRTRPISSLTTRFISSPPVRGAGAVGVLDHEPEAR